MLKSMLIGLDGSTYANAAMELGFQWAKRTGALLVGIGIVDTPEICAPTMVPIGGATYKKHADRVRLERARTQVEHFLEEFANRCLNAGVMSKLLEEEGLPHEQILLEAQRYDLVLLGKHTHFHFETQDDPDDTLEMVLKRAPCPVVAVPDNLPTGSAIVIAFDGSVQATRTLHAFAQTGLGLNVPVHLVGVAPRYEKAAERLHRAAELLQLHDVKSQSHITATQGSPADVILDFADGVNAGLVVMGSYGQPMLREFFLGSVTQTMLKTCQRPLFLFH